MNTALGNATVNRLALLLEFLRSRKTVPVLLIGAGLALVLYVGSQYGQMYLHQRRLARDWQEQSRRAGSSSPAVAEDSLARLVIPKIDLTSFVVEGTNHHDLLIGPGHMIDTAEPGETGNAVISGHRDTFFRHVHELEKGDKIFVDRGGKRLVYEVTSKKVVDPDDLEVVKQTKDPELTLITCYPTYYIGPAPKRLVITAKLAGEEPVQLNASDGTAQAPTHVQAVAASSTN